MSKIREKKNKNADKIPGYKFVIPTMLCVYMIMTLLIPEMDSKTIILGVASVCMIAWFIGERIFPDKVYVEKSNIHNKYMYIMAGIFLFMAILSEVCADDYSQTALKGDSDSIMAIISYMVLFYMSYRYFYMEKARSILKRAIVVMAIVVVIMSVIEFLDIPLAALWAGDGSSLEERNRVVLTFGNSNYFGVFCCMLIPFIMELWIHTENKLRKIMFIVLNGAIVCCVMLSKSSTAFYLMILITVAIMIYEYKAILKQVLYLISFALSIALFSLVLNILTSGTLAELIDISAGNADAFVEEKQDKYIINDINIEDNRLTIHGTDSSFIMEYGESISFYNGDGDILDIDNNENVITFTEAPYDAITVQISYNQKVGMLYVEVDAGYKDTIDFYIDRGVFKGVGADGGAVELVSGEYKEHEFNSLFTGRGYIWLNTVSMLDEVILLGKGCGNFVHNFPQYDYVGLLKSQGTHNVIIDRPHNMFLQYSIDIGIVGTVSLFGMIVYVLVSWIRKTWRFGKKNDELSIATFVSVVAFMAFSMLNDSLVILTPYMWIMLGANFSMHSIK